MNILLIRFSALGDVAMLAPVVREYALKHPDDRLTVLSKPFHAPLFNELAPNVYFLGRDPKRDYKGIRGLYRLFRELHQMNFDLVIDMHDVLRTKFLRKLFRMHGYPVRHIDKHRSLRRKITAPEEKKQLMRLPTAFENYSEALGASSEELRVKSEEGLARRPEGESQFKLRGEKEDVSEECQSKGNSNSSLFTLHSSLSNSSLFTLHSSLPSAARIGLAPFAAHAGKIYPLERMEKVIELWIEKRPECRIILFGGGGKEKEQMEKWAEKYSNVELASTLSEDSSLYYELQLMKDLDVMLSMDSGNMHMASLMGTRVVSIWGATHPWAGFLGWQQSEDDCVQRCDLKCRPCSIYGNKPCKRGDMECMNIEPSKVVEQLLK